MDLGADGGDLDGDAFDGRVPQVGEVGVHMGEGLLLAEDFLAQVIHVDPQAVRPALLQVGAERGAFAGDDDMAAVGAHFGDDAGHGVVRQETAGAQEQMDQRFFGKGEKARDAVSRQQVADLIRHPACIPGPEALVDEGGEDGLVVGVSRQPRQLPVAALLLRLQQGVGAVLPVLGLGDGLFHDAIICSLGSWGAPG